jgi:hypothetical protein
MACGRIDIHDMQRAMMAQEVRSERARTARALAGKTGGRGRPPRGRGRKEGFVSHGLPPYSAGGPPTPVGVYGDSAPPGIYRPGRELDIHEILKHEAFASSAVSCDDHFEKSRACPSAVYGVSDQYMILDSFEKVRGSRTERGEFTFNFMVQGVTRDQAIGVKDRLNTIIGIQVCDFCIPLLPFDDFDPARLTTLRPGLGELNLAANGPLPAAGDEVTNPQSQTPFCSRVTLFLKEIGLQSYSDADNRRHHFEFNARVVGGATPAPATGDRVLLTPLRHCEYFLFTDPIQDVHGLTVCFYNPGNFLRFPPDCLYNVAAAADGAQRLAFAFTDPTNLVNLAIGDRIYIKGFATGAHPVLDSYVTRAEGHLVGAGGFAVVGPTSSTSGTSLAFRLNPDVSTAGLAPPIPANTPIASASQIDVCIAKNRLRIPLRFRRVVGRLTNYIAP